MGVESRPLHPLFGAELDKALIERHDPELSSVIEDSVGQAGLLLFRDLALDDEALTGLASNFGPLQNLATSLDQTAAIVRITNLADDGTILPADDAMRRQMASNERWHIDSTYVSPGATYSFLYALRVPDEGGETEYCDTRVAWEALDEARQAELSGLTADHSIFHSRRLDGVKLTNYEESQLPPVRRKLVRRHEPSGRDALVIASHIERVDGCTYEEGRALVDELTGIAAAPERVYRHEWRVGDLLIWDNRCIMHRGRSYPELQQPRELHACRVLDIGDAGLAKAA